MMALQFSPGSPGRVIFPSDQAGQVAAPEVVEEAVFMVRVFRLGMVIAEVTTVLILPTGPDTSSKTDGNKIVFCWT